MNKSNSAEFKMEAVKRLEKSGEPMSKVAADLGVKPTIMQGVENKYRKSPKAPFIGSGHLSQEEPCGVLSLNYIYFGGIQLKTVKVQGF